MDDEIWSRGGSFSAAFLFGEGVGGDLEALQFTLAELRQVALDTIPEDCRVALHAAVLGVLEEDLQASMAVSPPAQVDALAEPDSPTAASAASAASAAATFILPHRQFSIISVLSEGAAPSEDASVRDGSLRGGGSAARMLSLGGAVLPWSTLHRALGGSLPLLRASSFTCGQPALAPTASDAYAAGPRAPPVYSIALHKASSTTALDRPMKRTTFRSRCARQQRRWLRRTLHGGAAYTRALSFRPSWALLGTHASAAGEHVKAAAYYLASAKHSSLDSCLRYGLVRPAPSPTTPPNHPKKPRC